MTPLEIAEQKRLQELEGIIEDGLQSFVATGMALAEIREKRLYKDEFSTFEQYCRKRWGLSRPYADQLISAQKVVAELETTAIGSEMPRNERQVRPLTKLRTKEKRAEAWESAVKAAGNGNPSAAVVQAAVEELQEPKSAGNGGPLDPTLEVAWILEFLSAWSKKILEFENATKVGKFSPEAKAFVVRRIDSLIKRLNEWRELLDVGQE